MPAELDPYENALRQAIRARVARGHLQVQVAYTQTAASEASLNRPLLQGYLEAFRQGIAESGLDAKPDLNSALRIPGMFRVEAAVDADATLEGALQAAAAEAIEILNGFREREGAAIVKDLKARCTAVAEAAEQVEVLRQGAAAAYQKRLEERLSELLDGAGIEPQRLAQEVALLVERSDVSEELVRLRTHAAQVAEMLAGGGEVGKRLDFLLQEMNRESNTLLSKTSGLGEVGLQITELGLAAKAEIDKIREQALNLE
jgi:uncharacterized protein (TIGR00255 family)